MDAASTPVPTTVTNADALDSTRLTHGSRQPLQGTCLYNAQLPELDSFDLYVVTNRLEHADRQGVRDRT